MTGLLAGLTVVSSSFSGVPVTSINGPAFQSTYNLVTCLCDIITAFLLLTQFRQVGGLALLALASGYIFSGSMAALHVLAIPGVLVSENVIGATANTSLLVRVFWLAGQPLGALGYVLATKMRPAPVRRINLAMVIGLGLVALLAGAVVVLTTSYVHWMPDLTDKAENWRATYILCLPVLLVIQVTAIAAVFWSTRGRTVLTLWLTVALISGLTETIIGWWLPGVGHATGRRYSLLFYISRIAGALSTSLLLLALLQQISALYARLLETLRSLKASEQRLVEQQRMEAIGQLAGGIAHDFNNLLMVISGNLELLRNAVPEQRQRRMVDAAAKAAGLGTSLTRQMLTFARRQMLRPDHHDIAVLLQETHEMISSAATGKVKLVRVVDTRVPVCWIDRGEFELAILNIVVNARDAMPEGGTITLRTTSVSVTPSSRPPGFDRDLPIGDYACIRISDTGAGMPQSVLLRAFEPFFTTKPIGEGTGLGLSQVYGFARQAGGDVTLASEPGRGTAVSIYLPLAKAVARPEAPIERNPARTLNAIVVLVEDTDDVRDAIATMLKSRGCTVFAAQNGPAGLALVEQHCAYLDVLLTDIVMPGGMTGVALAEHARRRCPTLPILMMTGFAGHSVADSDYPVIHKPFSDAFLVDSVHSALARRAHGA